MEIRENISAFQAIEITQFKIVYTKTIRHGPAIIIQSVSILQMHTLEVVSWTNYTLENDIIVSMNDDNGYVWLYLQRKRHCNADTAGGNAQRQWQR